MAEDVLDLDVLRPKPQYVKLAGKKIDVSFIPCAITWDIDRIVRELAAIGQKEAQAGGEGTKKAFDLSIELCALFCQWKHNEMDRQWFLENTDPIQIEAFSRKIQQTLERSYAGAEGYQKN